MIPFLILFSLAPPVENPIDVSAMGGASVAPAMWTVESQVANGDTMKGIRIGIYMLCLLVLAMER